MTEDAAVTPKDGILANESIPSLSKTNIANNNNTRDLRENCLHNSNSHHDDHKNAVKFSNNQHDLQQISSDICDNQRENQQPKKPTNFDDIDDSQSDIFGMVGGEHDGAFANRICNENLDDKNNEIPPPPGAPKPENTARLRRYRLNVE